jgi:hypothetical protein
MISNLRIRLRPTGEVRGVLSLRCFLLAVTVMALAVAPALTSAQTIKWGDVNGD